MNGGGYAFPIGNTPLTSSRGLTKREWFAGMAMTMVNAAAIGSHETLDAETFAKRCFVAADAMLTEAAK